MNCPHCQSENTRQSKKRTSLGYPVFTCHDCDRTFNERTGTAFNYLQFPTDIVLLVVVWRLRYKLSLRDLTEMFLIRGYEFTHEAVREWEERFAPLVSSQLAAKRRGQVGKSWYVDETYVKVRGRWQYLYRAIDRDGNLIDTRLSATRDLDAAEAFFRQAVDMVGAKPDRVTTDKHAAFPQAIQSVLGFAVVHRTTQYLNNRIEQDHRAIKQRYYPMRGFGSAAGAARFCTAYEELRQYFRVLTADSKPRSLAQKRQYFRRRCDDLFAAWQVA